MVANEVLCLHYLNVPALVLQATEEFAPGNMISKVWIP